MKYLYVLSMLITQICYSQGDQNNLNVSLDLISFNLRAKQLLKERYDFTRNNESFLIENLKVKKELLVTKFDFDSIFIKTIPVFQFKLKEGFENYVSCIDFTLKDSLQEYVLYKGDQIIFDGYYTIINEFPNNFEKLQFCLIGDSYDSPFRYGSKIGFLYNEFLLKESFVFKLEGFVNYIFLIENNLIYSVYYDEKDKIKKVEFNMFFYNYFKKKCVKSDYKIILD